MEPWIPLALLVLVAVVFFGGVLAVPFYFWRQYRQQHAEDSHPSSIIDMVVSKSGSTFIASLQQNESSGSRQRLTRYWRPALLLVGLTGMVVLVGLWLVPFIQSRLLVDQFVVLVTPFRDEGSSQPLASISDELARVLEQDTEAEVVVRQADRIPGSDAEARQIAAEHNADLLIWGNVQSGGFLNDATLQPRLTYAPLGAYAPHAWIRYRGRFLLEGAYSVARPSHYINGQAVLPPLIDALADYSNGSPDQAHLRLGMLLNDYPDMLDPTLPRMLRGNVLWARGEYADAANEYRALGAPEDGPPMLAANFSTILLDQGLQEDAAVLPDALAALNAALPRLEGAAEGTVRYNLGLRALYADDLPEAVDQLEQARALLPENAELLLALSEAHRENGQLAEAGATLDTAEGQISQHLGQVPDRLRDTARRYLQSIHLEQASLLQVSQMVGARGRLAWELDVAPPLPTDDVQAIIEDLRGATELSHESIVGWQRQSTTNAVARNVLASQGGGMPAEIELGLTALGQRQRVEDQRAHQHYYLALGLIEEGRTVERESRGIFEQFWGFVASEETPFVEARSILEAQGNAAPRSLRALLAEARTLRLHSQMPDGSAEMLVQADALYEQAIQQAPWRPEGFYGRGRVAWLRGDRPTTERLMLQALERDTTFFPARLALIDFARQDDNWDSVLVHLRTLQQQYDDFDVRLALASTLREAAAAGAEDARELRSEAERRLEALAQAETLSDSQRARAMVELGRLYVDQGREDRAEEAFRQALDADGDAAAAAYALGELLTRQGDYEGAQQQFLRAADDARGDLWTQAHLTIAQLYENQLQQPEAASEHYARLVRDDVRDIEALIAAGDGLLRHGETEAAVDAFRRAQELQAQRGANPALEYRLAESYLELGDLEAAYDHARQVLELTDDPTLRAAAYVVQGDAVRQMLRPGAFEEARAAYQNALALDIDQIEVHAELGMGQIDIGRTNWQQALLHFERAMNMALAYDPATRDDELVALTYFWHAEALQRQDGPQRDIPRAIRYYSQTLELRPALTEAWLGQAHAYHSLGEYQQARDRVEQALAERPAYPEALLFRARLLQERGMEPEALRTLDRAINIDDELGPLFYHRGMLLIEQDEFDAALDDLQRAVALNPDNSDAYYWLGRVNLSLDRANEALQALRESLELDASLIEARFHQGLAEESLNLIDEARTSFETVIQQAADSDLVQKAQEELERIQQEL
jgi:tetratricopeptide (TPR) repeat protein